MAQDTIVGSDSVKEALKSKTNNDIAELFTLYNSLVASGLPSAVFHDPMWADLLEDGTTPPDAAADLTVSNKTWRYRDFDHAQTEDAFFSLLIPSGYGTVKYRVMGAITNSTGPSDEGVAFTLAGYSVGDNDALSGTFGTAVTITKTGMTFSQNDIFFTDWSGELTITDAAEGELACFQFTRDHDHADDDYGQKIGVIAVILDWNA